MIAHLKDRQHYEDRYDRLTVYLGRQDTELFSKMYDEFFKIMPDEPKNSHRAVLHLNLIYVVYVGNGLLDRYDKREGDILDMMDKDRAKDEQITNARLTSEPKCQHCGKIGLRITDKMLMSRESNDEREDVLFMLKCPHCNMNSAYWEDGTILEQRKTYCPKCKAVMDKKDTHKAKIITTTYSCPSCGHSYKDKLDLTITEEEPDPEFEADRAIYCLHDEKARQELRDAKWRYDEMARLGKEWKEKEDNKHIYDAVAEMKKPKIAELSSILAPVLEKAGYIEFSLDKPEIGKNVVIGFNCLDSKSDRGDYDSSKTLQKAIRKALEDTNWRLTNDGISYRLGYLNGKLRAYEQEEQLKELVIKSKKLRTKSKPRDKGIEKNAYTIKDKDGNDIRL